MMKALLKVDIYNIGIFADEIGADNAEMTPTSSRKSKASA